MDIVKQMRELKRTKEWKDPDNTIRYSNVHLISKVELEQCLHLFCNGTSISLISKEKSISYERVKKAFNALKDVYNVTRNFGGIDEIEIDHLNSMLELLYQRCNEKQLKHER